MSSMQEPAVKSYFFGKGYRDLQATIAESWSRNLASARKELAAAGKLWSGTYLAKGGAILRATAALSVILVGTAFFLAFSTLHVAVLLAFFLLIYLGFTVAAILPGGSSPRSAPNAMRKALCRNTSAPGAARSTGA
jgi:hypothetical protein